MVVDLQIAGRAHGQVDQAVPRQLVQHVVEKPYTGAAVVAAGAVEVQRDRNLGLGGLSGDLGLSHGSLRMVHQGW